MRISGKIRKKSGVSMVLALVVMMTVSILCVSAMKISSSAPQTAYAQQDFEQSYLSATSAAKLLESILTDPASETAVKILGALDTAEEKTFALQLKASDSTASTVDLPVTQVTLTKVFDKDTEEASVNVSFSEGEETGWTVKMAARAGAALTGVSSVKLNIKTDVDIWRNGAGAIVLAKLYPRNYTGALLDPPASIASRSDYEPDVYTHTYKEASNDNTSKVRWTVIWLDGDGTELERATYLDGDTEPSASKTPTKEGDDRWWSYKPFNNQWTLTMRGSYKTYTPDFEGDKQRYTVIWLDDNNTTIQEGLTDSGTGAEPTPPATNPTKAETDEYSYTFDSWTENYNESTNTKTYTPNFTAEAKTYTVLWVDENGAELATASYTPATQNSIPSPTISLPSMDDHFFYAYSEPVWGEQTTENLIITYKLNPVTKTARKTLTVTWKNASGDTPYRTTEYKEESAGKYPAVSLDYGGSYPTKDAIISNGTTFATYTFNPSDSWENNWTLIDSETTIDANGNKCIYYAPNPDKFIEKPTISQAIYRENNGKETRVAIDTNGDPPANSAPTLPDGYIWKETSREDSSGHTVITYTPQTSNDDESEQNELPQSGTL